MKYKCLVCDGVLEPTESTNSDLLYFEPCGFCVNEHIKNEIKKNKNLVTLLNEALPYVSDMVGMASGARHVFHKILRITETHGVDEDEM